MSHPDLFDWQPAPRRYPETPGHRGVDTSKAAAESIEPHVGRLHRVILRFLRDAPAIRDEITEGCGLTTQTACGRLRELELRGLVHKAPETRPGRSGRECHVYKITEAGRDAA